MNVIIWEKKLGEAQDTYLCDGDTDQLTVASVLLCIVINTCIVSNL